MNKNALMTWMSTAIVLCTMMLAAISTGAAADSQQSGGHLKIATTTSLYETNLLEALETVFEAKYNVSVDTISGGTGIAIQFGERGDVDLLLVHDKDREAKFVQDGYGLERRCIAYNYFYILGPKDDPAGIKGLNATAAFETIMTKGLSDPMIKFVSRGDNSGTHAREKLLWKKAGHNYSAVNKSGPWYLEAGSGMGATLNMANEKQGYTLSDMSTFMAYKGNLTIVPLVEGGEELLNVYVAIAINPKKHPSTNCELANKFIDFLVSEEGQSIIAGFGDEKFGQPLFFKAAGACDIIGCSPEICATPATASCAA
jgi:tungstate transport system substrate-binding protein